MLERKLTELKILRELKTWRGYRLENRLELKILRGSRSDLSSVPSSNLVARSDSSWFARSDSSWVDHLELNLVLCSVYCWHLEGSKVLHLVSLKAPGYEELVSHLDLSWAVRLELNLALYSVFCWRLEGTKVPHLVSLKAGLVGEDLVLAP